MSLFTGDIEADQKLLLRMEPEILFNTCSVNSQINNQVCTDEFFEKWLTRHYPKTLEFKSSRQGWKKYALSVVYYDAKLQEEFGIKSTSGNPKNEYETMRKSLKENRERKMEKNIPKAEELLRSDEVLMETVQRFRELFVNFILSDPKLYGYVYSTFN